MGAFALFRGDALDAYRDWPAPVDDRLRRRLRRARLPRRPRPPGRPPRLVRPHVAAWSAAAEPATTLWFWNTEIGWASVHPVLAGHGWDYVS